MSLPLLLTCALASPAQAGDLWLTLDQAEDADQVHLQIPANWLAEADDPVEIRVEGQTVDLREVARATRERREGKRVKLHATTEDGQPYEVVVEHRRPVRLASRVPEALTFRLQGEEGEEGGGLSLRVPLAPGTGLFSLAGRGFAANLQVDAIAIPWTADSFVGQLRVVPPTLLLEVVGEDGGRVIVATE
jgi:hypothetical protein